MFKKIVFATVLLLVPMASFAMSLSDVAKLKAKGKSDLEILQLIHETGSRFLIRDEDVPSLTAMGLSENLVGTLRALFGVAAEPKEGKAEKVEATAPEKTAAPVTEKEATREASEPRRESYYGACCPCPYPQPLYSPYGFVVSASPTFFPGSYGYGYGGYGFRTRSYGYGGYGFQRFSTPWHHAAQRRFSHPPRRMRWTRR